MAIESNHTQSILENTTQDADFIIRNINGGDTVISADTGDINLVSASNGSLVKLQGIMTVNQLGEITLAGNSKFKNNLNVNGVQIGTNGGDNSNFLYASSGSNLLLRGAAIGFANDSGSGVTFNPAQAATNGQVLTYQSGAMVWANAASGGGIASVSQDTAPILGGNLIASTRQIRYAATGNDYLQFNLGLSNLTSDHTVLINATNNVYLRGGGQAKIDLTVNNNRVQFGEGSQTYFFPNTRPTNGQVLAAGNSGLLEWQTPAGGETAPTFLSLYDADSTALATATSKGFAYDPASGNLYWSIPYEAPGKLHAGVELTITPATLVDTLEFSFDMYSGGGYDADMKFGVPFYIRVINLKDGPITVNAYDPDWNPIPITVPAFMTKVIRYEATTNYGAQPTLMAVSL